MKTVGRNDPCPCGSGKKFKKCCEPKGVGRSKLKANVVTGPHKVSSLFSQHIAPSPPKEN